MKARQFWGKDYRYIWSDNWCLDGNMAWFIAGSVNALFCLDRTKNKTSLIDIIPSETTCEFRQHPRCIKYNNAIYCFPDNGEHIWRYHLTDMKWERIYLKKTNEKRLACNNAWIVQDKLYVVLFGLREIAEINIKNCKTERFYEIPESNRKKISHGILVDNCIYLVISSPISIVKFDCVNKSIRMYEIPEIDDLIHTLCFDGNKFWMSGFHKRIYIWEKETEKVTCLDDFPHEFGIWNFSGKYKNNLNTYCEAVDVPLFITSIFVGKYIWFIPFQTNEILYVDINSFEINTFHIDEEAHTEENISEQLLKAKYLLEYIRDDRYVGLFSLKNKWVFEIDSFKMKYNVLDYCLDMELRTQIKKIFFQEYIHKSDVYFEEEVNDLRQLIEYFALWGGNQQCLKKNAQNYFEIGKNVYSFIKN